MIHKPLRKLTSRELLAEINWISDRIIAGWGKPSKARQYGERLALLWGEVRDRRHCVK